MIMPRTECYTPVEPLSLMVRRVRLSWRALQRPIDTSWVSCIKDPHGNFFTFGTPAHVHYMYGYVADELAGEEY